MNQNKTFILRIVFKMLSSLILYSICKLRFASDSETGCTLVPVTQGPNVACSLPKEQDQSLKRLWVAVHPAVVLDNVFYIILCNASRISKLEQNQQSTLDFRFFILMSFTCCKKKLALLDRTGLRRLVPLIFLYKCKCLKPVLCWVLLQTFVNLSLFQLLNINPTFRHQVDCVLARP